jgi:hypothetical protein
MGRLTPKLTAARARELLDCDPETGTLTWRERPGNPRFNTLHAGRPAGCLDPTTGYIRLQIEGSLYYAHRIVYLHTKGRLPPELDHRDGNRTNNAVSNLRPASRSQNGANRTRAARAEPRGVTRLRNGGYQVSINADGKQIHLGTFTSPTAADRAYRDAADELQSEFAVCNRRAA